MSQVFFTAILPVFAVVLIGFLAGRQKLFTQDAAIAVNRFVFLIAVPALLFRLVSSAPLQAFPWNAAIAYLIVEAVIMSLGAAMARWLFRQGWTDSLLLGMSAGFVNHVFIILPITLAVYGQEAVQTVVAIIVIDSIVVFSAAIVLLDMTTTKSSHSPLRKMAVAMFRNPPVLGLFAGLAVGLAELPLHEGLVFFTRFVGDAGPPASLFALGVILSARAQNNEAALPIAITALKLAAMPAMMWLLLDHLTPLSSQQSVIVLLTSAAPCGAMPFVLALQFRGPAAAIARAILYSTFLSAFLIAAIVHLHPA